MEPFIKRVYFSIAVPLVLLWFGMGAWVVQAMNPQFLSALGAPKPLQPQTPENNLPSLSIPGVHFCAYRIAPGDSFLSLAQKFHLLEETLRSLNQANDGSQPKAGGSLLIPSHDGIFHLVRPGQTMADIARAYGISLKEILKANPPVGNWDLKPGDFLYLPGAPYLSCHDVRWMALLSLSAQKGFMKPTTGRFADGFGERIHPITHHMAFHEGLDLAPGRGARVVASQDGKVLFAGNRAGYGRLIILDHGSGLTSWYGHLEEILVKPNASVQRGQLIGKVGMSGRVTGPHLHFEIRLNGKPQNPFLYLVQANT